MYVYAKKATGSREASYECELGTCLLLNGYLGFKQKSQGRTVSSRFCQKNFTTLV